MTVRYNLLNTIKKWSGRRDLNPRPLHPQCSEQKNLSCCYLRIISLLAVSVISGFSTAPSDGYSPEDFRVMLVNAHGTHLESVQRDTPFAHEWNEWLDSVVRKPEKRIIRAVNFRFNRLRYQEDSETWDAEDYWAAPEQFYAAGAGDCEDYAMAKYFALLELGFPRDKLKIAIGWLDDELHAVLTYWDGDDPWILDNMRDWPQRASKRDDFRVIAYVSI